MARLQGETGILLNTSFTATALSLPRELEVKHSFLPTTFRPWSPTQECDDIVLLAEFSEIEGPVPLLTIPHKPTLKLDLNEFVVKVLSTDYLNTSGEFRVYEDTQMVQQDIYPGIHVYMHYFTLYDVRARGFVRPMCLAYISPDHRKLLHYFSQLRQHFTMVTNCMKLSNFKKFVEEMQGLIRDLEYTKDRYIQVQRTALVSPRVSASGQGEAGSAQPEVWEDSVVDTGRVLEEAEGHNRTARTEKEEEEEAGAWVNGREVRMEDEEWLLRHTTLEAVATQLMECQHILDIITPHMSKKDVEDEVWRLREAVEGQPECPLHRALEELHMLGGVEGEGAGPSLCVLSLLKRHVWQLRPAQQLCGVGYVSGLHRLRAIHLRFTRPFLTLAFEDLDDPISHNPYGSLVVGNVPVVNVVKDPPHRQPSPAPSFSALCWDNHFVACLRHGAATTLLQEPSATTQAPPGHLNVSSADDCLKVFVRADEVDEAGTGEDGAGARPDPHTASLLHQSSPCPASPKDIPSSQGGGEGSREAQLVSQVSTSSSSSSWSSNHLADLTSYEDIQEEEGVEEEVASALTPHLSPLLDIHNRMVTSKVCRLAGLMQQFCSVSHCLVHSLLSGRPVVLAAAEQHRPMVVLYVRALATLLPRTPTAPPPVLRWHTGTITEHHLRQYRLLGLCIPQRLHVQDLMSNATLNQVTVLNIETGHISGVAYSGSLVRGVEQCGRRLLHSSTALQASLQAILITAGLKLYLYYHLRDTTSRSAPDILKAIGVSKGDQDMVLYLTGLVKGQVKQATTPAS